MFGYDAPVVVFSVGALAVWGLAFWWSSRHTAHPWYYRFILVFATLFWWVGESLAIRLGKYEYPSFPPLLRLNVPLLGGTPQNPGWLENWVTGFIPAGQQPPWVLNPACMADSYAIPLPVVALEAALLFGFFRLARTVLRNDVAVEWWRWQWWRQHGLHLHTWRPALATGGLCAVLLVNAFAVLDPVVSTTTWCQPDQSNPVARYLPFGLWNWFTTARHPGFWFGVPIINYAAWFSAAAVFGFLGAADDHRDFGLIRRYRLITGYVAITLLLVPIFVFASLYLVKGVDLLLALSSTRGWHIFLIAVLVALALVACFGGQRQARATVDWVSILPKAAALGYSLWLLVLVPHWAIFIVFVVTLVVAAVALWWPYVGRRVFGDDIVAPPQAGAPPPSDVDIV